MTKEQLINRRKAMGLTREQLAARVGRSYRQISRWEAGRAPLPDWLNSVLAGVEHEALQQLPLPMLRNGRPVRENNT